MDQAMNLTHLIFGIAGFLVGLIPAVVLLLKKIRLAGEAGALRGRLTLCEESAAALGERARLLDESCKSIAIRLAASEAEASRISSLESEIRSLRSEASTLMAARIELQAALDNEKNSALEKMALLGEAQTRLGDAFKALSAEALRSNNQSFLEIARTQLGTFQSEAKGDLAAREKAIGDLLKPMNDQLVDFKASIVRVLEDAGKERLLLQSEVGTLARLNQSLGNEAKNLAQALKGSNKIQGDWGEMILEQLLEASGIRKGTGFSTQRIYENEDSKKGRPDVILHLPSNRCLVVDSKVSIDAYAAHCAAEDPIERQSHLKKHLDSLREHIDGLSKRDYSRLHGLGDTLDFVVMFVPVEPAFLLAISQDGSLFMEAWRKNVLLASPSTLLYVLRIVEHLWRQENQTRNALEIADRGAKLYEKFQSFVAEFQKIGKSLDAASQSFHESLKLISTGRGNLISQAEKLRDLGVKPAKSLPPALVEQAVASDADDASEILPKPSTDN